MCFPTYSIDLVRIGGAVELIRDEKKVGLLYYVGLVKRGC